MRARSARRGAVGVALALAALLVPAAARAVTYAPIDRPGPPLDVPSSMLAAALRCSAGVDHATRAPVLLVPGTGSTPADNFGWNYEPAFEAQGIPWCAITLPEFANGDIQVAGEYVVYAIRTESARAGRPIAIIGHSQGGMVPRWALRFWPDTRAMVADMIGFAPTNHGTTVAATACQNGCSPADRQQENTSHFIEALNSYQETFPGIAYTDVYTHNDEEVQPNRDDTGTSSLHGGGGLITNVAVQDICPADSSEHLLLGTVDAVAYALALDALNHPGQAADPSRIPASVCLQPYMPGINPVTGPAAGLKALIDDETSPSASVTAEPPLACYVTATCGSTAPAPPAAAINPACAAGKRFIFRLHTFGGARVVRAEVDINGRRVKRVRGHRLRAIAVVFPRGARVIRIVSTWSNGVRRTSVRHYARCVKGPPKTRTRHPRR